MNWRRIGAITGALTAAGLLAFPLREAVHQLLVVPLSYLLWLLGLMYRALDQIWWWFAVALILIIALIRSLLPDFKPARKEVSILREERGKVEVLASALKRTKKGTYFKWMVANRLGKLAYQILLQREHGKPRSVFAPLVGEGWDPEPEVQGYLEKGLHGSFADFPNSYWHTFAPPQKTPLDHDVREVVEFLESKQGDSHFYEAPPKQG